MNKKRTRVHNSPLSGTIFAGIPLKDGMWGTNKTDVTMDCYLATAASILQKHGGEMEISYENDKGERIREYKITVEKL